MLRQHWRRTKLTEKLQCYPLLHSSPSPFYSMTKVYWWYPTRKDAINIKQYYPIILAYLTEWGSTMLERYPLGCRSSSSSNATHIFCKVFSKSTNVKRCLSDKVVTCEDTILSTIWKINKYQLKILILLYHCFITRQNFSIPTVNQ